jgi:competence protein ComEC
LSRLGRHLTGRPLVVFLAAYLAGLLAAAWLDPPLAVALPIGGGLALAAGTLFAARIQWWLAAGAAAFFVMGLVMGQPPDRARPPADHVLNLADGRRPVRLIGLIDQTPQPGAETSVLYLRVLRADGRPASGRIRITLNRISSRPAPGDLVRLTTRLKPIHSFANPGGFDYAAYMARRGVRVRAYLFSDSDLTILARDRGGWWLRVLAWFHRRRTAAADLIVNRLPPSPETLRAAAARLTRWVLGPPRATPPWRRLTDIRARWRRDVIRDGPPAVVSRRAAFYLALLLGQRRMIPRDEYDRFAQTGVAHLLAVSGLHLGIIVGLFFGGWFFLLRRVPVLTHAGLAPVLALLLTVPPVTGYALLCGGSIPTLRALIMFLALAAALVLSRGRDLPSALALAALVILVVEPWAVAEVSFQLSFFAVAGIVICYRPLYRLIPLAGNDQDRPWTWSRRLGRVFWGWACVSLAATLATLPWIAWHFHRLSLISLPANLIIVPLVAMIALPLGLIALAMMPLFGLAAGGLIVLGGWFVSLAVGINSVLAGLPGAWAWIIRPTGAEMVLFWIGVVCLVFVRWRRWARVGLVVVVILFGIDAAWWTIAPRFDRRLTVTVLDVGQGSAAVLRLPDGRWVLIDGGGFSGWGFDTGRNLVAPFLWSRRVARVATIINTHPETDHFGGLIFLVRHFSPREVWINGQRGKSRAWDGFLAAVKKSGARLRTRDDLPARLAWGPVRVEILHPPAGFLKRLRPRERKSIAAAKPNRNSFVIKISYGRVGLLFPGDIPPPVERRLSRGPRGLHAQFLLAAHHGARRSNTIEFLGKIRPKLIVFSAGVMNRWGHPHPAVLARARALGARTLQTNRHGAVTFSTDGQKWTVRTCR